MAVMHDEADKVGGRFCDNQQQPLLFLAGSIKKGTPASVF
jgi:hypothetical protein